MAHQLHENHVNAIFVFIVATFIAAITPLLFLKKARIRITQLCSKRAKHVTCVKVGCNFLNVLPAKDMYRAASVLRAMQNFLV